MDFLGNLALVVIGLMSVVFLFAWPRTSTVCICMFVASYLGNVFLGILGVMGGLIAGGIVGGLLVMAGTGVASLFRKAKPAKPELEPWKKIVAAAGEHRAEED